MANIISVSEASSDDETWVWNPLTCQNECFYWPLSAKSWIHDAGTKLVFAPDETDQDENHAESSSRSQIPTSQTPVKSHSKDKKPQLLSQEPEIPDEWLHFSEMRNLRTRTPADEKASIVVEWEGRSRLRNETLSSVITSLERIWVRCSCLYILAIHLGLKGNRIDTLTAVI